ncbi:hypothetical protein ACFWIQ_25105 [Kitasatospora sp. NPDC127059]|uniref:hypothetical protein n=1 Tax=unclassified Kitasatospora TaxID=2633591 RepID=UPI00364720B9
MRRRIGAIIAAASLTGISVVGLSGAAHAGTTGSVSISVPGCIGHLNLSANWAYGHLDSYTTTCWLTIFDRNDQTGGKTSQTISYGPGGSGDTGQFYHDSVVHAVAIAISNGSQSTGSAWYH